MERGAISASGAKKAEREAQIDANIFSTPAGVQQNPAAESSEEHGWNRFQGRTRSAAAARLSNYCSPEGVTHHFGNAGTTELPIMHALADYPDTHYVLGLQEAIVVAMADGYARASGEL